MAAIDDQDFEIAKTSACKPARYRLDPCRQVSHNYYRNHSIWYYSTAHNAGNADIYNLVNPHPIAWESLLGTLQSHLGHQVDIVSLRDWINSLLKLDVLDSSELARHPALKLLEIFEEIENGKGSLAFDAEHGVRASKTMATLYTVNPAWMNVWLERWKF